MNKKPCKKKSFRNEIHARLVIAKYQRIDDTKRDKMVQGAYKCHECHKWHLTSRKPKRPKVL